MFWLEISRFLKVTKTLYFSFNLKINWKPVCFDCVNLVNFVIDRNLKWKLKGQFVNLNVMLDCLDSNRTIDQSKLSTHTHTVMYNKNYVDVQEVTFLMIWKRVNFCLVLICMLMFKIASHSAFLFVWYC